MRNYRYHLLRQCDESLRRLGTDYIDIYHLHGFDALTPIDEVMSTLNHLVESGKVRYTKTSLMLGLGETETEIAETMDAARAVGVDIFTMGQYLQPSKRHLEVVEFVAPEKFGRLREVGLAKGFRQVVSSPLSRSSYHAEQAFS